jgi:hypothetical protein
MARRGRRGLLRTPGASCPASSGHAPARRAGPAKFLGPRLVGAAGRLAPEVRRMRMRTWRWAGRRPAPRRVGRWLTNPWVLSALGLAAASYVGLRIWRRA